MDAHSPVTDTNASYAHFKDQRMQSSVDNPAYTDRRMIEVSIRRPQLWVNSEDGCLFRLTRARFIDCVETNDNDVETLYAHTDPPSRSGARYMHEFITISYSAHRLFVHSEHGALLYATLASDSGQTVDVCDDDPGNTPALSYASITPRSTVAASL